MTVRPGDLEIVDAHHHLWDLGRNYYPWLADHPEPDFLLGDYEPLKRNYLPEDYRRDAAGLKVLATVHVEAERDRTRQVAETEWLHEVAARSGMPNAVVAHAWFHTDDCEEILAAQKRFPLVRGIRSKPVTARSAGEAPPTGPGSMHDPKWLRGLALLEKHDLSWDLRVPFWHLHEAADVCARIPGIRVVLNHTGLPWDRSDAGLAHWRSGMQALAACPNVHCKVSELGLKGARWTIDGNRRVVREAIEVFGIDRCMFASNFPVAGLRIGYRAQIAGLLEILSDLSRPELDKLFRDNARRFYRID
jgi:predicted TIM-barrel fold metal-dependent hydrolase